VSSNRRVRATIKIDLADSCGSGRPVDTAAVAGLLRRRAAQSGTAAAETLSAIADSLTAGGTTAIRVDMTPRAADGVRDILVAMEQAQIDARRKASDLAHVRRSWESATDYPSRSHPGAYPR
jgi:hypothetical protein